MCGHVDRQTDTIKLIMSDGDRERDRTCENIMASMSISKIIVCFVAG